MILSPFLFNYNDNEEIQFKLVRYFRKNKENVKLT